MQQEQRPGDGACESTSAGKAGTTVCRRHADQLAFWTGPFNASAKVGARHTGAPQSRPSPSQCRAAPGQLTELWVLNTPILGTSLEVQWLKLCAANAVGVSSVRGQGTKIPHAAWPGEKEKVNRKKNH